MVLKWNFRGKPGVNLFCLTWKQRVFHSGSDSGEKIPCSEYPSRLPGNAGYGCQLPRAPVFLFQVMGIAGAPVGQTPAENCVPYWLTLVKNCKIALIIRKGSRVNPCQVSGWLSASA